MMWAVLAVLLAEPAAEGMRDILDDKLPSLSDETRDRLADAIVEEARAGHVDLALVLSVIEHESWWDHRAKSKRGAKGLMQMKPAAMREMLGHRADPYDPVLNVRAGVRYLSQLVNKRGGNVRRALMTYNTGPGNMRKYARRGHIPEQVQTYAKRVFKTKEKICRAMFL